MKEYPALVVLATLFHIELIVTRICLGTSTAPLRCHSVLRGIEKLFVSERRRGAVHEYPFVHETQKRRRPRHSSPELISAIKLSAVS